MKKLFKIVFILLILATIGYFAFNFFFSGKSTFRSIYLVPANAAFIIESDDPFEAWEKIIHSKAWEKVSDIEYLAKLNSEINKIDSLLSSKRTVLRALGHRNIMVSAHEYLPGKYDFLYILNIGKAAGFRNPEKIISSALGENYSLTSRNYKGLRFYELLDRKSGSMYFFSLTNDKVILSENLKLVEASISEKELMALGRDLSFINTTKGISGRGLFTIYINYKYFSTYLETSLGKASAGINKLKDELTYSAFSFDISSSGQITLEGYTAVNESVQSFYNYILETGTGGLSGAQVIPNRIASLVKISINDAPEYFKKRMNDLSGAEYQVYKDNLQKIEKKLKINFDKNFLSWIDNEIILIQTQPSNLGKENEFAAIIKGTNNSDPMKNLDFVGHQIEKNTPVKIKKINYEGFPITYISFPGLLKALFGKMLDRIEKPYYTVIDRYIIFSNHPQTLKNIIDEYNKGNTLARFPEYESFVSQFNKKSNAFVYIDIPVLFNNVKQYVTAQRWQNFQKNKSSITCFPQIGIQIDNKNDLLHLLIKAEYRETFEEYTVQYFTNEFISQFDYQQNEYKTNEDDSLYWYNPKIIINELDTRKQEEKYENGKLHYTVGLKNGLKHGSYREYYEDGRIRIKGEYKNDLKEGMWKFYANDGNLIEEKEFDEGVEKIR